MNNATITSLTLTMSSQEIADLTGKEKKTVHRDIKVMVDQLYHDGIGGTSLYQESKGGVKVEADLRGRARLIHLDRKHAECLLTGYSAKARMKVIERWHELEEKNKPEQPQIPTNFAEALQLAADQAKQLELAAPKVAFVDNLVSRENLMTATQVASKHKMSAVKLNKILDELGGVYNQSVKRGRVFIKSFIESGYGELKQTEQGYSQALFTPAGEVYINEKLISEGVI